MVTARWWLRTDEPGQLGQWEMRLCALRLDDGEDTRSTSTRIRRGHPCLRWPISLSLACARPSSPAPRAAPSAARRNPAVHRSRRQRRRAFQIRLVRAANRPAAGRAGYGAAGAPGDLRRQRRAGTAVAPPKGRGAKGAGAQLNQEGPGRDPDRGPRPGSESGGRSGWPVPSSARAELVCAMTVTMPSSAAPDAAHLWSSDANEALRLSLVRAQPDKASLTAREVYEGFHPTFTYPIYGEEEKIYGYRELTVDLKFASGSLTQLVNVSYAAKLPSISAVDDVEGTLAKFIPPGYYTDEAEFLKRVETDALEFRPPGERILSYTRPAAAARKGKEKGKNVAIPQLLAPEDEETVDFEVYHCTWDTPGFREYHRRMQLFILLYIEAGSFISEDEDGWEFVLLFERRRRRATPEVATYHFVGYSTLYPFYCFPERVRMRLSQFVILPPYQQEGHGSALYTAIYQYVLATPSIAELTVEDPAEAFEDLRDRNDLKMLLADEQFMREALGEGALQDAGALLNANGRARKSRSVRGVGGEERTGDANGAVNGNGNGVERRRCGKRSKLGPPVDKQWVEQWRVKLKIASRQFNRLIEMLMLKHLDESDSRTTRAYRLQVKERLYRFNYDALMQLDKEQRVRKIEETFRNVSEDYRRILALLPH